MREVLQDLYAFIDENRIFSFFAFYFICEASVVIVKTIFIGTDNIIKSWKGLDNRENKSK